LFGRVDLPDLVRLGGAIRAPAAWAAGACRLQAVAAQPALQGAGRRHGLLREAEAQLQAEPAGTPARVLPAQVQERGQPRRRRGAGAAGRIVGGRGRAALPPEAVE
jgi:hypothetical protein